MTAAARPAQALAGATVSVDPVVVAAPGGRLVLRVTAPATGTHLPVLVFSHGNALNRSDYRPLVEGLARQGYVVIQPDHADASTDGIPPAGWPDDTWHVRYDTLMWLGTHLGTVLREVPGLARRADLSRSAIAGHSFGGHSAAMVMGAQVEGAGPPAPSPYRAGVLLSAPGNWDGLTPAWKDKAAYLKVDWSTMRGPVLMINGTADAGPMSERGAAWHDDGFLRAGPGHDICLLRIAGAGHYLGGIDSTLRPPSGDATPERRAQVLSTVTAFLDHALARTTAQAGSWPAIRRDLACK